MRSTVAQAVTEGRRALEEAEEDLLAFYSFPSDHWPKLRSTNPLDGSQKHTRVFAAPTRARALGGGGELGL
jgi:transposase-like protein